MNTTWTDDRLARLFDRYNRRFWNCRLPKYSVIASGLYRGGLCKKRERQIFLNLDTFRSDEEIRGSLLHEMAHAATRDTHGKYWQNEMKRLAGEGAPILKFDLRYDDPRFTQGLSQLVSEFEDAAWKVTWKQARLGLGWSWGLIDRNGKPTSTEAARVLLKARKAHARGRRQYLKFLKIRQSRRIRT